MSQLIFPTPILAVKGAVCFTCLKKAEKLNRCKGCKRVWYCSAACQKKDWKKAHKHVCPVLAERINPLDKPCEQRTWQEYREDMWPRIDAFRNLPKPLLRNDERILQYQPHCATCHRNTFQLAASESTLTICDTCQLAHHCSNCSATPHQRYCDYLWEVAVGERFSIQHYLETGSPNLAMPTGEPRTTYLPLSAAKSWLDYFTIISDKPMLIGRLSSNLEAIDEASPRDAETAAAMRAATDKSTMILTILAALEVVFTDLGTKESLNLHLIGAMAKEMDALPLFEELLHLLPNLRNIHCSFIGPEMPSLISDGEDPGKRITLDCCPPCANINRTRSMSMHKSSYHEFTASSGYTPPDLAVAFHTGHSQEALESWYPTIRLLSQVPFPTVFTTFNKKEMEEETEILSRLNVNFLVKGAANQWKGMRPLLEVAEEEENGRYFNNEYWYVIGGKKKTNV